MISYKVHFENRFILVSSEPERLQKYSLFHKFNDTTELYKLISDFQGDQTIHSVNIYANNIALLWRIFRIYFSETKAAGGLVKHQSGRYLFIERRGKWDLPKGHIEPGEEPEACALREVEEECGITGHRIVKALPSSFHTYSWEGISYLKQTYWFLMDYDGEMKCTPQEEEGISKAVWLYPDDISHIRDGAWVSLLDLINAYLLKT
jgi:8-oxo-dGTP pyrophosphatase MutT (NUDIX family)